MVLSPGRLAKYAKRESLGDYLLLEKSIDFVEGMAGEIRKRFQKGESREEIVEYLNGELLKRISEELNKMAYSLRETINKISTNDTYNS